MKISQFYFCIVSNSFCFVRHPFGFLKAESALSYWDVLQIFTHDHDHAVLCEKNILILDFAAALQAAVLDFFGVPVKAQDVLGRIKELTLLGKRINRFKDPVAQFRLKSHPRVPSWSKVCEWSQGIIIF